MKRTITPGIGLPAQSVTSARTSVVLIPSAIISLTAGATTTFNEVGCSCTAYSAVTCSAVARTYVVPVFDSERSTNSAFPAGSVVTVAGTLPRGSQAPFPFASPPGSSWSPEPKTPLPSLSMNRSPAVSETARPETTALPAPRVAVTRSVSPETPSAASAAAPDGEESSRLRAFDARGTSVSCAYALTEPAVTFRVVCPFVPVSERKVVCAQPPAPVTARSGAQEPDRFPSISPKTIVTPLAGSPPAVRTRAETVVESPATSVGSSSWNVWIR